MKKRKEGSKFSNLTLILLSVFIIVLIFTLIDVLVHSLSEEYAVPDYYFRNKIIFGTIIGFVTYLFVKKIRLLAKSLIFSAVVSILLQIRYFLEGYPLKFVIEFLFFHFLMLIVVSLICFKIFDKFLKGGKILRK
ncbi:MAG: hypothetical protein Q8N63_00825 [Nanoarchaeota archaeon]|nr:hypothetical protein [Nanoarchaeota archaeon]